MQNVAYLEDEDFSGNRLNINQPAIIMILSNTCGHCKNTLPIYQQVANQLKGGDVLPCAIQIDGNPSEKRLFSRLQQIVPNLQGVPTFVKFQNGGLYKVHQGPRTVGALIEFARS